VSLATKGSKSDGTKTARNATLFLVPTFVLVLSPVYAQKPTSVPREQEQDDVVRVSTALVTVPVTIHDRHGKLLFGLRQQDFRLYEDGVEQQIVYFDFPEEPNSEVSRSVEKPLTTVLLLDTSDSTEFKLKEIQRTAIAFIDALRKEDRAFVVVFDKEVRVLAEATSDRATLKNAVSHVQSGGGTSLYDALDLIINHRLNRISGRKAIVLLTDGVDTSSTQATYVSTVRAAEQLDAAIYPIQYNTYGDFIDNSSRQTDSLGTGGTAHLTRSGELASEAYKRATTYLRLLAEKTGGRFQYTDNVKSLSKSFARIASNLRQQYTLGYYPKNQTPSGKRRELRVSVSAPKVSVRTRKSYIYKPLDR
jgi:Ca-activated chloride channel homolog